MMDHQWMGIQVELRVAGDRVRILLDPDGGSFDAAGDFDRLLPQRCYFHQAQGTPHVTDTA
jgi:hypothetical protein